MAGATAFALVAAIFVSADFVWAGEQAAVGCHCPKTSDGSTSKLTDTRIELDQNDELAALESVQLALTEVADGSSYFWRRTHGRLSGLVKPLSSFKDPHGDVCRHAVVVLAGVESTKRTEIVACRMATGIWQLQS